MFLFFNVFYFYFIFIFFMFLTVFYSLGQLCVMRLMEIHDAIMTMIIRPKMLVSALKQSFQGHSDATINYLQLYFRQRLCPDPLRSVLHFLDPLVSGERAHCTLLPNVSLRLLFLAIQASAQIDIEICVMQKFLTGTV